MNTPALAQDNAAASSDAGMPLRLAQRAFASLIEERAPADVANLTAFAPPSCAGRHGGRCPRCPRTSSRRFSGG